MKFFDDMVHIDDKLGTLKVEYEQQLKEISKLIKNAYTTRWIAYSTVRLVISELNKEQEALISRSDVQTIFNEELAQKGLVIKVETGSQRNESYTNIFLCQLKTTQVNS